MPALGIGELLAITMVLAPVALLVAVLLFVLRQRQAAYRACPFCAESIRKEAVLCKHCGRDVPAAATRTPPNA